MPQEYHLIGKSQSKSAIDILNRLSNWINLKTKADDCYPLDTLYPGTFQVLLEYGLLQYITLVGVDSEEECHEIIELPLSL